MTEVPPGGEAAPDEGRGDADAAWPPKGWVEAYDGRTTSRTRLVRREDSGAEELPTGDEVERTRRLVRDLLQENASADGETDA